MCLIQISSPKFDIEHGELLLYQNMVLREAGRPDKALDHLMQYEPMMHDKLVVREIKGSLNIFVWLRLPVTLVVDSQWLHSYCVVHVLQIEQSRG